MIKNSVNSSNLSSVSYKNGILEIQFNDSSVYQYSNVPYSEYKNLMNASSHGKYFHANIKNIYPTTKIS